MLLGKILSSQSRSITVWNYEPNLFAYVIPLYSGLEASLGSNLEIVLDLRKSHQYQQSYKEIVGIPSRTPLLNLPRMQTPLLLNLSCKKTPYKTLVYGQEVSQGQLSQPMKQVEPDLFYDTGPKSSILQLR